MGTTKVLLSQHHIDYFRSLLGAMNVIDTPSGLMEFGRDWTSAVPANPSLVLTPESTAEVSTILRYCSIHNIAVVPSGGRTGLAGGAVAANGEVVLSLGRMDKILEVDTIGMTISVEAGVTTQAVKDEAENAGLFFALDLAAKGSSQIGGNIATNAGGLKLIRYGGMRELVLGVEVVLASGEILDLDTPLIKNNTGYDLRQLFIGSEGTLGVITKATLRLSHKHSPYILTCLAVNSFSQIATILQRCNLKGIRPSAFEFMTADALQLVMEFHSSLRPPFSAGAPYLVLIETEETSISGTGFIEDFLQELFEEELITDGIVASSSAEFSNFWALRENISESCSQFGHVYKNDISVAIKDLEKFVNELEQVVERWKQKIRIVLFGHIGDGNVHINYLAPKSMAWNEFLVVCKQAQSEVFASLTKYRGSVSAEHGIGLLKKAEFLASKNKEEVALMKQIKRAFDPQGILNPGKIFDVTPN